MAKQSYERLTGLDHAFLHFETPTTYMHVALTAILGPGSLAKADGGIDFERIRRHVDARLPQIPRYRQRLHYMPVTGNPVWVDDPDFNLGYHVRHSHLPRPGTDEQLKVFCARILERPLDRHRPLWEMWIVEGLEGGNFAMLCKVHHCMVDGVAGMGLVAALLSAVPETGPEKWRPWVPMPPPTQGRLLGDEIRRRVAASLGLARKLPEMLKGRDAVGGLLKLARTGLSRAADTPLNRTIGPHRRVDWASFDLTAVKAVKERLGGTVNDVVLAVVAGTVRRILAQHQRRSRGTFRVLVPVSTRSSDEREAVGNRISAWLAPLPVDEPDVLARYHAVSRTAESFRANHEEKSTSVLVEGAEWATAKALETMAGWIRRARMFNLVVTNVPGPQFPLYLLDAPMLAAHPHVPLFTNQGLGIALLSYCGRLDVGLVADWDIVPDLGKVSGWIEDAFEELHEAAHATGHADVASIDDTQSKNDEEIGTAARGYAASGAAVSPFR